MNKAVLSFVISAIVGLMFGYVLYDQINGNGVITQEKTATAQSSAPAPAPAADQSSTSASKDSGTTAQKTSATTVSANQDNIIVKRGCIQCHSVASLNIKGGQVGPDLSNAYNDVQSSRGLPIEQFLTKPNSAVMSGVLGGKPLTDDQRQQVLDLLKKASEAKQP